MRARMPGQHSRQHRRAGAEAQLAGDRAFVGDAAQVGEIAHQARARAAGFARPASVMRTVRPTRTISGTPISRSSVWICWATAAEVMFSTRAAAAIEPLIDDRDESLQELRVDRDAPRRALLWSLKIVRPASERVGGGNSRLAR